MNVFFALKGSKLFIITEMATEIDCIAPRDGVKWGFRFKVRFSLSFIVSHIGRNPAFKVFNQVRRKRTTKIKSDF